MKIGIIREGKVPPDTRVPLDPKQCAYLRSEYGLNVVVQPSPIRIFKDEEYVAAGVPLEEYLGDCDLLLGVKEVPKDQLIPGKTYSFFSHTHKQQIYNRPLLQAVLNKHIHLIDYEVMTDNLGRRIIAFGYFAGVVGAHNGFWTYAKRTGSFELPRMKDLYDYAAAKKVYAELQLPPMKIVLTGTGRVSTGAAQVLEDMGVHQVSPRDFLRETYDEPIYTQLVGRDYLKHKDGDPFDKLHFYQHPEQYVSAFQPYFKQADMMINGIYWDNRAPAFFTKEDMANPDFNISVIADVTCDIAPVASIPATLRASTIADPVFGYDPQTGEETAPYQEGGVDMMTIDNLPSELPRDASTAFGKMYIEQVIPHILAPNSAMIERATIARHGRLGPQFGYLLDFVEG
ncbi:MAG: NAD(P)-dependent oxidoreductase [Lewinella sp.]|jgi:alanine dehydrogenase|uniref:NAD(P)-dependent oxidoreductase n=1 Tax=Lewinella sp. TaxID=2004506 RepID=UPI003D6C2D3B